MPTTAAMNANWLSIWARISAPRSSRKSAQLSTNGSWCWCESRWGRDIAASFTGVTTGIDDAGAAASIATPRVPDHRASRRRLHEDGAEQLLPGDCRSHPWFPAFKGRSVVATTVWCRQCRGGQTRGAVSGIRCRIAVGRECSHDHGIGIAIRQGAAEASKSTETSEAAKTSEPAKAAEPSEPAKTPKPAELTHLHASKRCSPEKL